MVDDLILINSFESSAKSKHITKENRIALAIVEQNNPFNMASIKGRVIEQTTEGADEHLKKLAKKYLGIGKYFYRKPSHKRIILKIKPEQGPIHSSCILFLAFLHGTNKSVLII